MAPFIEPPAQLVAQKANLPNPDEHAIAYEAGTWAKWFERDNDLAGIIERHPLELSRRDVGRLATEALAGTGTWRGVFMAAMMWGYGPAGYGPWRVGKMLCKPEAIPIVTEAAHLIAEGQFGAAYDVFQLPWCKTAFATKFFYFVGLSAGGSWPLPVILDSVVASSLERLGIDVSQFATSWIPQVRANAKGYIRYVDTIDAWATTLGCRADQIEMWLFTQRPG